MSKPASDSKFSWKEMNRSNLLPSLPLASKILIIRLRSVGDIVLLTPAMRMLKQWRPDLRISVMVEARFRELLEGNPDVDEILEPGSGKGFRKVSARARMIRAIRKSSFDLCLNLHGGPTSAQITALSGAKWRAGFFHFRQKQIYNLRIPDARQILGKYPLHTAEHVASAFFWMGMPQTTIPSARLELNAATSEWWAGQRARVGLPAEESYALLHPPAVYFTKQWAPEKFAALGNYLERELKIPVLYSCGPSEGKVLATVEAAAGKQVRKLESVSLKQFAAALAGSRLFVGNDSGPAHMAAALGIPSVIIFGSSSSPIWGPWRPGGPFCVVQNSFDCNPCAGDRCYRFTKPECILSITLEQVQAAVQSLLAHIATFHHEVIRASQCAQAPGKHH
jgi:lipopolysaccharide heptosyltransferase III